MPLSEYPSNLGNPFTLGVASGDPSPDGFVLWTRLAPDPLNGGGMDGQQDVAVDWEVATDVGFADIVRSSRQHSRAIAEARLAHSVHLEVTGLEPGTHYYYRSRWAIHLTTIAGRRGTKGVPRPRRSLRSR